MTWNVADDICDDVSVNSPEILICTLSLGLHDIETRTQYLSQPWLHQLRDTRPRSRRLFAELSTV